MDFGPIGLALAPGIGKGVLEGVPAGPLAVFARNLLLIGHTVNHHAVDPGGPVAVEGAGGLLPVQLIAAHEIGQYLVGDELPPGHMNAAGDVPEILPHLAKAQALALSNIQHAGGCGGVDVAAVGLCPILTAKGVRPVLNPQHMIPEVEVVEGGVVVIHQLLLNALAGEEPLGAALEALENGQVGDDIVAPQRLELLGEAIGPGNGGTEQFDGILEDRTAVLLHQIADFGVVQNVLLPNVDDGIGALPAIVVGGIHLIRHGQLEVEHLHASAGQGLAGAAGVVGKQQGVAGLPFLALGGGDGNAGKVNGIIVLGIGQLGLAAVEGFVQGDTGGGGLVQGGDKIGHILEIGENVFAALLPGDGGRYGSQKRVGEDKVGGIPCIVVTGAGLGHGKLQRFTGMELGDGVAQLLLGGRMVGVDGVQGRGPVGGDGEINAEMLREGRGGFQNGAQHLLPAGGSPAVFPGIEVHILGHHGNLHAAEAGFVDGFYLVRHPVKVSTGVGKPAAEHALCVVIGRLEGAI